MEYFLKNISNKVLLSLQTRSIAGLKKIDSQQKKAYKEKKDIIKTVS